VSFGAAHLTGYVSLAWLDWLFFQPLNEWVLDFHGR